MNQLTYVHDYENSKVYSYTHDTGGNILAESISNIGSNGIPSSTKTIFYSYGDENWGDKLTAYDGETITYDAIGNPLSYRDGITMTWKNGRQLATLQNGTSNVQYSYDSDSVRVSKTVNGVKHTYAYINGMLMYETRGDAKFYYSYDANGILYSVKYTLTDSSDLMTYYYTHNSRGDIVGIYNGAGQLRAQYEYDAWGNVQSITDQNGNAITSETHIGNLNPFRYRGYYYDTESGFYYLMSRYYDPVTHRFINADGYFQAGGDILDANMSAYCANNPIMYWDPTGSCYVEKRTSAGTYIGTHWVVQTAVPSVPGFCNDCKSYGGSSGNNNYVGYSEHNKKGTTNPLNKSKHQKGQKRKQNDKRGGEKGDVRRPINRSNKRHFEIVEPNIEY